MIALAIDGNVKRLKPLWERRSRTGNHGEDCYTWKYLERASVFVHIEVSNSGRHYCNLTLKKQLTQEQLLRIAKWLAENEHICESIASNLVKAGLPEEVLLDLVQRDP